MGFAKGSKKGTWQAHPTTGTSEKSPHPPAPKPAAVVARLGLLPDLKEAELGTWP